MRLKAGAVVAVMTDSCEWPHVVHRPDGAFPAPQYLVDNVQRQESLIYIMKMYDVSLLEFASPGDTAQMLLKYFSQVYLADSPNVGPLSHPCGTLGINATLLIDMPPLTPTARSVRYSPT